MNLSGFAFGKGRLPRKPWLMALFGFVTVVLVVGPILDSMSLFLGFVKPGPEAFALVFVPGFAHNCPNALCTAAVMLILGKPFLSILNRIQVKYGMLA